MATALDLPDLPSPPFAAIEVSWFDDADGALAAAASSEADDGSVAIVVDEVALRGADYLANRWADGGERCKMVSWARRAPLLSAVDFSERWKADAGSVGSTTIPDELRGQAYVQDHPVLDAGVEWPFDAINEVWFDDLDHLLARATWMAERQDAALRSTGDSIFDPDHTWSMCVRELLVG